MAELHSEIGRSHSPRPPTVYIHLFPDLISLSLMYATSHCTPLDLLFPFLELLSLKRRHLKMSTAAKMPAQAAATEPWLRRESLLQSGCRSLHGGSSHWPYPRLKERWNGLNFGSNVRHSTSEIQWRNRLSRMKSRLFYLPKDTHDATCAQSGSGTLTEDGKASGIHTCRSPRGP